MRIIGTGHYRLTTVHPNALVSTDPHIALLAINAGVAVRRQPLTPEQVSEAVRLYESGLSLSEVAERLQVNQETMRMAILKAGVTLRPATKATP